jgi:hypothetical protein
MRGYAQSLVASPENVTTIAVRSDENRRNGGESAIVIGFVRADCDGEELNNIKGLRYFYNTITILLLY